MNNMLRKKFRPFIAILIFLIFFTVIVLDSTVFSYLTIKTAALFLPLPLLIAYSFFGNIKKVSIVGFLVGACADSVANGSYCFNTVMLMLIATAVCLLANTLFNKNIHAILVMSLLFTVFYFSTNWLVFGFFGNTPQLSMKLLLGYSLPSAIYTAVFILPFYFVFKYFNRLLNN